MAKEKTWKGGRLGPFHIGNRYTDPPFLSLEVEQAPTSGQLSKMAEMFDLFSLPPSSGWRRTRRRART